MNWMSFKNKFHRSWHKDMKPFIESEACDKIFKHLKARSAEGITIAPSSRNTFRAFEVPKDTIKVVILGGNPYDGFIDGRPIANGRYLDCTMVETPSFELQNFYRGLEIEMFNGLNLVYRQDHYSTLFLEEQGVLMLTSALTVEEHGTHTNLWEPFMNHVMDILVKLDVPIIFMGEQAQSYRDVVDDYYKVFSIDEPAGTIKEWDTQGVFQKVDQDLEEHDKDAIMWLPIDCPF